MIVFDCVVYSKKIKELNRWHPNTDEAYSNRS